MDVFEVQYAHTHTNTHTFTNRAGILTSRAVITALAGKTRRNTWRKAIQSDAAVHTQGYNFGGCPKNSTIFLLFAAAKGHAKKKKPTKPPWERRWRRRRRRWSKLRHEKIGISSFWFPAFIPVANGGLSLGHPNQKQRESTYNYQFP